MALKPCLPIQGRIDDATSNFLDAARWLAALVVVLSHAGGLLLVGPDQVAHPSLPLKLYFCLRNGGHAAVVVFFVVSGFLVGGQELIRMLEGRPFDLRRYAVQRFSRIYVVLIPALLLTGVLDHLGQIYFNRSLIYTTYAAQGIDSLKYVVADRHDAATFAGNLLMLQTIAVPPFGGNGPLWSLANEWWYYVIFGLALLSLSANRPPMVRIAALCGSLIILGRMPQEISLWFTLWLLGVGAAVLGRMWRGISFNHAICVMLVTFAFALYGMTWPPLLDSLPQATKQLVKLLLDASVALSFALLLLSARNGALPGAKRMHKALAGFSYTLYLVHFPALIFLGAVAHDLFGVTLVAMPHPANVALALALVAILCVFAWGLATVTERHTAPVRDRLLRLTPRVHHPG